MKLEDLLNQLLEIANKQTDPSLVEVQLVTPEITANITEVVYKGPNNTFTSLNNIPRIELR